MIAGLPCAGGVHVYVMDYQLVSDLYHQRSEQLTISARITSLILAPSQRYTYNSAPLPVAPDA